jgi:death-on-curing protein
LCSRWESLAQNHPFIDGNKRTAFAATYTFLAINRARITADAEQTYVFIAQLYEANDFTFKNLLACCGRMSRPMPHNRRLQVAIVVEQSRASDCFGHL